MDSHELAEKTTGLASRVNNLAVEATGDDSRTLLGQQDDLIKLAMAAIVRDLDAQQAPYKSALQALDIAIQKVGSAGKEIDRTAKAIKAVASAIKAVAKVVT